MFEFLTREGRARIAKERRARLQSEKEQRVLCERQDYERKLATLPKFNQAYYWFDSLDLSKYHLYSDKEIVDFDVYYLGQMIEAIDDVAEKIDIAMLTEKSPIQVFSTKVSHFMIGMLDVLCGYKQAGIVYSDAQLHEATKNYATINPEYIKYILRWSADHNIAKARMFLYEYLKWQGKDEDAEFVKDEAKKLHQTPWFWETYNHYQSLITDGDDTKRFSLVRTGGDFEEFIKWKLEMVNIVCDRTGSSGDQGVDILVYGETRVAIQCKFYNHDVDNSAVQQVYAGMHYYDCGKAIVVSNAGFTPGARQLAKKLGVTLCNYKDIVSELKEYGCVGDDLDEVTPMGTVRGIREMNMRHPERIV